MRVRRTISTDWHERAVRDAGADARRIVLNRITALVHYCPGLTENLDCLFFALNLVYEEFSFTGFTGIHQLQ